MLQPVHDVIDSLLEMREREILGPDFGDLFDVLPGDMRERSLEIGEVFFGEMNGPATGVGEFVASPYIRSRYRLGENLGHRRRSFAARAAPAAQSYGWIGRAAAGQPTCAAIIRAHASASAWVVSTCRSQATP